MQSVTATGWQENTVTPGYDPTTDYFIDPLMEGTAFFQALDVYTELSVSASSWSEQSVAATVWAEVNG